MRRWRAPQQYSAWRLPSSALRPSGGAALNLFAHTLPARNIGGDFYDYFLLEDRRLAITVGDVSGKGIPAALFMPAVQTALRLALKQQQTVDAAIAAANDLLVTNNDEAMFATLFCALIGIRSGVGVVCNCGHPSLFVLHRRWRLRSHRIIEPTAWSSAGRTRPGALGELRIVLTGPPDGLFALGRMTSARIGSLDARFWPVFTRSEIIARSNSAKTPHIWNSMRPPGRRGIHALLVKEEIAQCLSIRWILG